MVLASHINATRETARRWETAVLERSEGNEKKKECLRIQGVPQDLS